MPIVRRPQGAPLAKPAARPAVARPAPLQLALPTQRSAPKTNMLEYSWLIYGEKKIGKTSLCSQFPDALVLLFEPGGRALRLFKREVNLWSEFVGYIDLLLAGKHNFKTVVIDTVDQAYDRCFEHMCRKLCIEHPHDENDYGKSWGQIEGEFVKQINRLLNSKYGVVFISHAAEREVKTRSGEKFDRLMPTMSNQANKLLTAVVDIWAYYGYEGEDRVLQIRGDEHVACGSRLEENFNYADGSPIKQLGMGNSAKEAYANLCAAFANKLPAPKAEPVRRLTARSAAR